MSCLITAQSKRGGGQALSLGHFISSSQPSWEGGRRGRPILPLRTLRLREARSPDPSGRARTQRRRPTAEVYGCREDPQWGRFHARHRVGPSPNTNTNNSFLSLQMCRQWAELCPRRTLEDKAGGQAVSESSSGTELGPLVLKHPAQPRPFLGLFHLFLLCK